jgi:hypothetical protein
MLFLIGAVTVSKAFQILNSILSIGQRHSNDDFKDIVTQNAVASRLHDTNLGLWQWMRKEY